MSLLPVLVIAGVLAYFFLVHRPRLQAATDVARTDSANLVASAIASRFGLSVVEGDPSTNLMLAYHDHLQTDAKPTGEDGFFVAADRVKRTGVTLRGAPNGRDTEVRYWIETKIEPGIAVTQYTRTLDFRVATQMPHVIPDFEIVLRRPSALLAAKRRLALPEQRTGDETVDGALTVTTQSPDFARHLAPLLRPFVGHTYVHILGCGGSVALLSSHETSSYAAYFLDDNLRFQHALADSLAGRGATHVVA